MIIQIEQGYNLRTKEDVYNVKLDNKKFGQFFVPEKNDNIRFHVECFVNNTVKNIAKTINAIFNKPVTIQSLTEPIVINGLDDYNKVCDIYVLIHTKHNKYNVQSFLCFNDRIGSVHIDKTATGNIKDITFNAIRWAPTAEMVPNGAYQLTRMYKQNIKMNVMGRSYTVTPKNWLFEIKAMYEDKILPCYGNYGEIVGTYQYTEKGIEYYPDSNTRLPDAVKSASDLQSQTGRQMTFMSPNKQYSTLVKLFTREFNRKK